MRQIQRTVGTTTILVTHDQAEAMALSDRVVVMNHGRAEQIGPPHEAYERPATPFVANFLGRTNLVNGATVRPEKIWFATSGLAGKVRTRIFQGNHWLYQIETAMAWYRDPSETGEAIAARGRRCTWSGRRYEVGAYLLSLRQCSVRRHRIVPLGHDRLLSFHDWGQYKGIERCSC